MDLDGMIRTAKRAPFYAERIRENFEDTPVLTREDLVNNTPPRSTRMLTGRLRGAYVFSSGGTTASPVYAVYSPREFREWGRILGQDMGAFISEGDTVANLCPPGNLWVGYALVDMGLATTGCTILPLGANAPAAMTATVMKEFGCNAISGVPSTLNYIAKHVQQCGIELQIDKVYCGGEFLSAESRGFLREVMHVKEFYSAYGCVFGGYVGMQFTDRDDRIYRIHPDHTHIEILNERGERTDGVGRIVLTSLDRELMPVIRYDTEDIGRLVDDRHVELVGRAAGLVIVGGVSFSHRVVEEAVSGLCDPEAVQLRVSYDSDECVDVLEVLVGTGGEIDVQGIREAVIKSTREKDCSEIEEFLDKTFEIRVKRVRPEEMETSERTGKMKKIVDAREV
jgi:phenylacetate-CoA ligase